MDRQLIATVEIQLPVGQVRPVHFRYDAVREIWRSDAVVAVRRGSGQIIYPSAIILSGNEISQRRVALLPKHLGNFRDLPPRVVGWADRPDINWHGGIAPSADRSNWDPDAVATEPEESLYYRSEPIVRGIRPAGAAPASPSNSGRVVEVLDEEDAAYQQGLRDGAVQSIADIATLRTELSRVMAHAAISRSDLRIEAVVHAQAVLDNFREAVQKHEAELRTEGAERALSDAREKVQNRMKPAEVLDRGAKALAERSRERFAIGSDLAEFLVEAPGLFITDVTKHEPMHDPQGRYCTCGWRAVKGTESYFDHIGESPR